MLFTEARQQPILGVAERLNLRLVQSGRTVFTHCPDHRNDDGVDQNPSCSLNLTTNHFKCWSCANTGSSIDLVAQVHRCSLTEAARWLTGQHDLPAPPVLPGAVPNQAYLSAMLEDLLVLCGELSPAARRYLERRGIDPQVARRCRVTDVSDYPAIEQGLLERYPRQDLVAAGLFSIRGHLKFYQHCLLFPFLKANRAVYLTARRLDSDQKPKFLSVNGPIPHLYNDDALAQPDPVWIAEGVTDTLTLLSEAIPAVGIIGAFTFKPAWAGSFAGREVSLALDADDAGRSATEEIATLLRAAGGTVRIAELPEGTDVNTYYLTTGLIPHVWRQP